MKLRFANQHDLASSHPISPIPTMSVVTSGFVGFAQVVEEPRPKASPMRYITFSPERNDYDSEQYDNVIQIRGHHPDTLLFRVYDSKSASPLLSSGGFTATQDRFREPMSNNKWAKEYQRPYSAAAFRKDPNTRKSIIKHVLGGWPGYTSHNTGPSAWISATESFDWAVWEVARRLVVLYRDEVGLALIRRRQYYAWDYRGTKNVVEDVEMAIGKYGAEYGLDADQKAAMYFASASSEMVYLGRIPERDIVESYQWTRKVSYIFT